MLDNRIRALANALALGTLLLVGLAGGAAAQLLNGSFESPNASGGDVLCTTGWNCFNDVYTTATVSRMGTQCLKTYGPFVPAGGSGATQMLPTLPGQTWVGRIWAMNWSFDPLDSVDFGVYKIEFLNASMQLAAGGLAGVDIFESNPINATLPRDTWTLLGVGTAPAPAGTVWVRAVIVKVDLDGAQGGSIFWDDALLFREPQAVSDPLAAAGLQLWSNTPNPFSGSTQIDFAVAQDGPVDISVHDAAGRLVASLLHASRPTGYHSVSWDGRTTSGSPAPAGVYWCVMRTATGQASRNMILVR